MFFVQAAEQWTDPVHSGKEGAGLKGEALNLAVVGIPPAEHEEVAGDMEVCAFLLKLLPP